MSSNRPNLANAFAPASSRGAKLEGILAPKRRKAQETEVSPEPQRISVVPELPADLESVADRAESAPADYNNATDGPADDQESASAGDATRGTATQKRKKPTTGSNTKASETVPGALRNVGVYLAPDLLATVKETLHSQRTTYADLLLDAFDAVSGDTIAKEFKPESVPSTSSGMPRRVPRRRGEAGIQIQVRLDGNQTAWLDDKVIEFNAPSRSALVSTVYRLHLAG